MQNSFSDVVNLMVCYRMGFDTQIQLLKRNNLLSPINSPEMPKIAWCNANNQIIWNPTSANISEISSMQNSSPSKSKASNTMPYPCQVYA